MLFASIVHSRNSSHVKQRSTIRITYARESSWKSASNSVVARRRYPVAEPVRRRPNAACEGMQHKAAARSKRWLRALMVMVGKEFKLEETCTSLSDAVNCEPTIKQADRAPSCKQAAVRSRFVQLSTWLHLKGVPCWSHAIVARGKALRQHLAPCRCIAIWAKVAPQSSGSLTVLSMVDTQATNVKWR